ncbi:Protein of unknown function [Bacillus mycoides]|uniref:Uncharacterized protein n=1 Tax=Bacillus mycoides TaxID=1405 RepID=A0A1G4EWI8_BACMY|nr:Protein of unknown function [Bacillus mycoides]
MSEMEVVYIPAMKSIVVWG